MPRVSPACIPGTRSGTAVAAARAGRVTRSQNGIRRTSAPCVRRTKPVRSPSAAALVTTALRVEAAGNGDGRRHDDAWRRRGGERLHRDVPGARSAAGVREVDVGGGGGAGVDEAERDRGGGGEHERDIRLGRIASPPPPRVGARGLSPSVTVVPVSISAALSSATDQVGCRSRRSAAAPEICGVAIDVPDIAAQRPPGTEERIDTPGALTSGFRRRDSGVGPDELKSATMAAGRVRARDGARP